MITAIEKDDNNRNNGCHVLKIKNDHHKGNKPDLL